MSPEQQVAAAIALQPGKFFDPRLSTYQCLLVGVAVRHSIRECLTEPRNLRVQGKHEGALALIYDAAHYEVAYKKLKSAPAYSEANSAQRLQLIFGTNTEHQTPDHLLGALLCADNGFCHYAEALNPYPRRSRHYLGVQVDWEMAKRWFDAREGGAQ